MGKRMGIDRESVRPLAIHLARVENPGLSFVFPLYSLCIPLALLRLFQLFDTGGSEVPDPNFRPAR